MKDLEKSKEQLLEELDKLRQKIALLESANSEWQRSQELYRLFTDTLPLTLWKADDHWQMIECNRHWYNFTGQTPEEAQGRGWLKTLHPDDVAKVIQRINEAQIAKEPYQNEFRVQRASDGSYRWHIAWALPMMDQSGRTTGWVGSITDIDDRKRAEQERDRDRAVLAAAVECFPFEFFAIGTDGRYMLQNATLREHYGDAIGKCPEDYAPDDAALQLWLDNNRRAFAGERVEGEVEAHVGGDTRYIYNIISPIRDGGKVCGILGVNLDITERKRAEEALKKAHDELERRIEERTAELVKANENLDIFRKFAEASGEGFGMSDLDARIAYVNPALCRLFGEDKPKDLIGRSFLMYYPEEWKQRRKDAVIPAQESTEHWAGEQAILSRQGQLIPTLHDVFLLRDEKGQPVRRCIVVTNITERKRAEEALRKSEVRFRSYFEQGLMGMAVSSSDMRWTRVNDRLCKILGYAPEELRQRKLTDFVHPDDLESTLVNYRRLMAGEIDHSTVDRRYIRKDGKVVYLTVFVKCFRSEEGTVDHILAVFEDITERKQAQDALAESEAKYRRLVETTDTGYLILDEEGRVVDANEEYVRLTGHQRLTEIMGRRVLEWTAPHDVEHNTEEVKKCLRMGSVRQLEVDYIGPDGKVVPIEINAKVIHTIQGRRIISLCRDITERKQAEAALRQSHDELQAIHDMMVDGLLIGDCATKRLLRANPAICRMLGYSHEELLSMTVSDIHPPEEVPHVLEMFEKRKEGQKFVTQNRPLLRKDGTVFYADIGNTRMIYNGQPCMIGIFRDITERKLAQEALQKEHRTLKHLLQSSDHERQTIAYEIHDGLAQYLAGAIMQFDVYKHQLEKKPNDAAKAYVAAMTLLRQGHSEARRLIAGIRHPVLDEAGVVEAVAHLITEQNREKGPKIEFRSLIDFSRLVPLLENAIYRIIQEGMANACKYSESSRVRITLLQQKDRLRIEIRDWGIGFDTNNVKESSYGLAGIRERARLLGGKYRLQSVLGKGTRIVIELPLMEREE